MKNKTPRMSFIIPVYKPDLDVLTKCIKALKAQSLKDWEAVFVLDGEDKAAESLIRREMGSAKQDFDVIKQPHGGAPRARNAGAEKAKGEFWVFWDCDCVIEVDSADQWVRALDKDKDIDFVYQGYKFLGEQGALDTDPFDPWTLRVRNYISGCYPFRKERFKKWNEDLKSLQDWDFWLNLVDAGAKGKMLEGYGFSTKLPSATSISGQGCSAENWLSRVNAVKDLHKLPYRNRS